MGLILDHLPLRLGKPSDEMGMALVTGTVLVAAGVAREVDDLRHPGSVLLVHSVLHHDALHIEAAELCHVGLTSLVRLEELMGLPVFLHLRCGEHPGVDWSCRKLPRAY